MCYVLEIAKDNGAINAMHRKNSSDEAHMATSVRKDVSAIHKQQASQLQKVPGQLTGLVEPKCLRIYQYIIQ